MLAPAPESARQLMAAAVRNATDYETDPARLKQFAAAWCRHWLNSSPGPDRRGAAETAAILPAGSKRGRARMP